MTQKTAMAFWRDLMGTLWKNPDTKATHGIMNEYLVADHMGITPETAKEFLDACCRYGITERQGGAYVI